MRREDSYRPKSSGSDRRPSRSPSRRRRGSDRYPPGRHEVDSYRPVNDPGPRYTVTQAVPRSSKRDRLREASPPRGLSPAAEPVDKTYGPPLAPARLQEAPRSVALAVGKPQISRLALSAFAGLGGIPIKRLSPVKMELGGISPVKRERTSTPMSRTSPVKVTRERIVSPPRPRELDLPARPAERPAGRPRSASPHKRIDVPVSPRVDLNKRATLDGALLVEGCTDTFDDTPNSSGDRPGPNITVEAGLAVISHLRLSAYPRTGVVRVHSIEALRSGGPVAALEFLSGVKSMTRCYDPDNVRVAVSTPPTMMNGAFRWQKVVEGALGGGASFRTGSQPQYEAEGGASFYFVPESKKALIDFLEALPTRRFGVEWPKNPTAY
ncbi:uncharacterized protein EV422DRAFT_511214 [Fimicolochytrium jonesii]|uniref:uncharacterized protein n=1 Tax=Fimicolochytrium jonesii TaxID=1396493 RepID=UPI0022FE230A|nr:uncharacterized protein EV422DRAFT_511214 [Fimicolochytrium jonesii]KAI8826734.1 hypothetical protein EV422DRAFT_511214 [Fimicolochytrium jonesii]